MDSYLSVAELGLGDEQRSFGSFEIDFSGEVQKLPYKRIRRPKSPPLFTNTRIGGAKDFISPMPRTMEQCVCRPVDSLYGYDFDTVLCPAHPPESTTTFSEIHGKTTEAPHKSTEVPQKPREGTGKLTEDDPAGDNYWGRIVDDPWKTIEDGPWGFAGSPWKPTEDGSSEYDSIEDAPWKSIEDLNLSTENGSSEDDSIEDTPWKPIEDLDLPTEYLWRGSCQSRPRRLPLPQEKRRGVRVLSMENPWNATDDGLHYI